MAERTTQSWTTIPHFFVTREIDATALNETRERLLPAIDRSHGADRTCVDLLATRGGTCEQEHRDGLHHQSVRLHDHLTRMEWTIAGEIVDQRAVAVLANRRFEFANSTESCADLRVLPRAGCARAPRRCAVREGARSPVR